MNIKIPNDCGNAPKKIFLKDYYIAIVKGDEATVFSKLSDDIVWSWIGHQTISSKEGYTVTLPTYPLWKVSNIHISSIITHGIHAAVRADFSTADGRKYEFCDVLRFQGHRTPLIKSIDSFLIEKPH